MHILVTGGTSGIGENLIKQLDSKENTILFLGRNEAKAQEIIASMKLAKISFIKADLSQPELLESLIVPYLKSCESNIDAFVHCAGIGCAESVRRLRFNLCDNLMKTNFLSFVEILRCLVRLKKNDTSLTVVAISSISAKIPFPNLSLYAASKGALEAFVRTASIELAKSNVCINALAPGRVDTPMTSTLIDLESKDAYEEKLKQTIQPLGLISPDEIVAYIKFLLSGTAKHVTGSVIEISGGFPVIKDVSI